jgi:hypothetical protein
LGTCGKGSWAAVTKGVPVDPEELLALLEDPVEPDDTEPVLLPVELPDVPPVLELAVLLAPVEPDEELLPPSLPEPHPSAVTLNRPAHHASCIGFIAYLPGK